MGYNLNVSVQVAFPQSGGGFEQHQHQSAIVGSCAQRMHSLDGFLKEATRLYEANNFSEAQKAAFNGTAILAKLEMKQRHPEEIRMEAKLCGLLNKIFGKQGKYPEAEKAAVAGVRLLSHLKITEPRDLKLGAKLSCLSTYARNKQKLYSKAAEKVQMPLNVLLSMEEKDSEILELINELWDQLNFSLRALRALGGKSEIDQAEKIGLAVKETNIRKLRSEAKEYSLLIQQLIEQDKFLELVQRGKNGLVMLEKLEGLTELNQEELRLKAELCSDIVYYTIHGQRNHSEAEIEKLLQAGLEALQKIEKMNRNEYEMKKFLSNLLQSLQEEKLQTKFLLEQLLTDLETQQAQERRKRPAEREIPSHNNKRRHV